MMCESCSDKEATMHLTQVVDGAVKKLHLCEDCAAKHGFDIHGPMSITDMLLGMGQQVNVPELKTSERSCPRCHMRRADFKKTSRMGCPQCYETFAAELPPLLKAIHRSERHTGKVPSQEGKRVQISAEVERLRAELDEAIVGEKYEEAARLRDKIRGCREKIASDEAGDAT